ncbi:MAG: pyridoxal-dependent decarboxylase [Bacteroidales bacterium]
MIPPSDFAARAGAVFEWIDRYLNHVREYPVKSQVQPGEVYGNIPAEAPRTAEPLERILADLDNIILPGITHWQHPNFHAYFPANGSVESLFGEFVTATLGAQCMIWETSPAAAELEQRMMEWLRQAMGLPESLEGVIQDSASSATLAALLTAREVATGFRSNEDGVPSGLRVYASAEAHSSIEKGMGVAGLGRKNLVKIPVDARGAMIPEALKEQIEADRAKGLTPIAVVACLGTTGTVAVDPLKDIAPIAKAQGLWLHVDAAFAGSALLLPEYAWMKEGMEDVDSFVFNPHKWLFTHFDCSVFFVKRADLLIRTFEILPEYLKTKTRGQVNDYRDWGVPLGRRFRALKLWFVIRGFGLEGLQNQLRKHIELNQYFTQQIEAMPGMELMQEPFLNFSCFRLSPPNLPPEDRNALNKELLERVNRDGSLFLTHTVLHGAYVLRALMAQTYLEKDDVDRSLAVLRRISAEFL